MKHNLRKTIRTSAKREQLSAAEREKMQFVISEYMALKPLRTTTPPAQKFSFLHALYQRLGQHSAIAGALSLLLLAGTSGVAFAAEKALPGDTLYPVKLQVTEPIQTLFTAPKERAAWHMTLAERRIEEGATLSSEGKLSTTTENQLVTSYRTQITEVQTALAKERHTDPLTVNIFSIGFAAQLDAYDTVLSKADSGRMENATSSLRMAVRTDVGLFRDHQISSSTPESGWDEFTHTKSATDASRTALQTTNAVQRLHTAVTAALQLSADVVGTSANTLDATTSAEIKDQFQSATALAAHGKTLLEQHDTIGASHAFEDTLSATARLNVLTRAASKLKINVFGVLPTGRPASERNQDSPTTTPKSEFVHRSTPTDDAHSETAASSATTTVTVTPLGVTATSSSLLLSTTTSQESQATGGTEQTGLSTTTATSSTSTQGIHVDLHDTVTGSVQLPVPTQTPVPVPLPKISL